MGLLIFDCDGVLVDSEYLFARVASECLARIGIDIDPDAAARRFAGVSLKDLLADIGRERGVAFPDGFEQSMSAAEDDAYTRLLEPIAGVREAITAIAHRRCVASSSLAQRIDGSLAVTRLDDLFEEGARFSTALVPRGKPAPDIFLHAASAMGEAIEACVVIEDSVPGVTGAVAAGMRVVGFHGGRHCGPGHAERLAGAGAHVVIADMAMLPEAVRKLMPASAASRTVG